MLGAIARQRKWEGSCKTLVSEQREQKIET
jgi:hypothetical protein